MNKKAVQYAALGALVLLMQQVEARRAPFWRDQMPERGCPCANKPKPKPKPAANAQMVEQFRSCNPAQQRSMLAMQVETYMENPCDETAMTLMACAQTYCDRVKNQEMNMLVKELVMCANKEPVQEKILRCLGCW